MQNSTYNRDMHHFRVTNGPGYSGSQRSSPNDIGENSQFRDGSYGGRGSQRNSPLDFPQASHFRESGVSPHFRESPLLASGARSPQDPAEVAYTRERERDLQSSQLPRSSPSMSGGTASNRTTPEISGGSQVSSSAASVLNKPARASPSSMSANAPPYPYGGRPQEDPVAPQSTLQRLTSAMNMPVRGQGRLLGRGAPQGPPGNGRYPQGDFNMKDVEHALDGVVGAQRHDDVQYNAYYNDGYRPQHYDGEDGHFVPEGPPRSHMVIKMQPQSLKIHPTFIIRDLMDTTNIHMVVILLIVATMMSTSTIRTAWVVADRITTSSTTIRGTMGATRKWHHQLLPSCQDSMDLFTRSQNFEHRTSMKI